MNTPLSRKKGKISLVCCLCIVHLLLSGCWDRAEVNDLALITGAAIDKAEGQSIELSVQVYIPRSSRGQGMTGGDEGGGSQGGQTFVRSAEGRTMADAISTLQQKLPRRIFWGHTEIFIIDSKLAREGIRGYVDFMLRHPQIRESAYIFISDKKAKKMLEPIPFLERSTSEVLRELAKSKIGMEVTIKDLNQRLSGDARAAGLPWIKELPPNQRQEGKKSDPYIIGTAVFKKDKMVGHINEKLTRGVLWARNEIRLYMESVAPEEADGYISMRFLQGHSKLLPKIENGEWKITIQAKAEEDIVQNGTNLDLMMPKYTRMLEKVSAEIVQETVQAALIPVQKKMNADIFGFADAFHRKYPKQWNKAKGRWDEIFPEVKVSIEVKAYLRRPGMITVPGGLREEEVRKK